MTFATIEEVWGTDFNEPKEKQKHNFSKIENNFNKENDILFEYNKQTLGLPLPIAFNEPKRETFLIEMDSKLFSNEQNNDSKYESLIIENQQLRNRVQQLEKEINSYKLLQNYLIYSLGGIILIYLFDSLRK